MTSMVSHMSELTVHKGPMDENHTLDETKQSIPSIHRMQMGHLSPVKPRYGFPTKENTWKDYSNRGILGKGTFGVVTLAANRRTQEMVAIKSLVGSANINPLDLREVQFFCEVPPHPSLVNMSEMYTDKKSGQVNIVMERMEFTMLEFIQDTRESGVVPIVAMRLAKQMLRGIAHIHSLGFVHRDLKPENILLGCGKDPVDGKVGLILKLADFGLSRRVETPGFDTVWTGYVATRWYRTPEQLLRAQNHGYALDIWSFGTVTAEMCNGKPLFPGRDSNEMIHHFLNVLGSPRDSNLGGSWTRVAGDAAQKNVQMLAARKDTSSRHIIPNPELRLLDTCTKASLKWDPSKRASAGQLLGLIDPIGHSGIDLAL